MAQKKAHEVESWLARPDPRIGLVLLYGPDRGLVAERAKRLAASAGVPLDDPFSVVRLDASGAEAGQIAGEARMVPMFSAKRLVWVRDAGAQRPIVADVSELAAQPAPDALVIVEAGDLKKGHALRAAVENSSSAMALPCYADEGRGLDAVIDEEMAKQGYRLDADARQLLKASLGGDRLASRRELEKLALYAQGQAEITAEDVRAAISDASNSSADDVAERFLAGDAAGVSALIAGHVTTPAQVNAVLAAVMRQMQQLHALRGRMEVERRGAADVVAGMRPPAFGNRKPLLEKALTRWDAAQLTVMLGRLQRLTLEARARPELGPALLEETLLGFAARTSPRA
ncbi:MAG TPA: DNA polymerase III subunit delta [Mesorhizobium sp.]|jgi:DNA polymerase-3 subunit delta|nr:DNA polymerase III subunit delta [Mesorhizobium sp.]